VYACREGRVSLGDVVDDGIRPVVERPEECGSCTACLDVCPGYAIDHIAHQSRPGTIPELLCLCGPVLEVWEGHAADPEVHRAGSSGGMTTALALHCLEHEGMHGVAHIGNSAEAPLANRSYISRTRDELLGRTGSRYAPASPCDALQQIAEAPGPCVFVGKPCDATGLAKTLVARPELGSRVGLVLSFFCAGTPATRGTLDYLAKHGVDTGDVEDLVYRGEGWPGRFGAKLKGGGQAADSTYEESWGFLQAYRPYRCYLCPDSTGEDADIACGDAWYKERGENEPGSSIVLVRTERGLRVLQAAIESGHVVAGRASPSIVTDSQVRLFEKRHAIWGRLSAMRLLGVPAPRLKGFRLGKNWLQLSMSGKLRSTLGTARRILSRGYRKPLSH
jgi:coenzyme F420 hydrogenase subunit beta